MSFETALAAVDRWVSDGVVRGASAAIWHRGRIVARRVAGEARPGVPVDQDTAFALASVSKPITATAVLRAVDDGDLTLDTPVAAIVGEFAEINDPGDDDAVPMLEALRDRVTVRHLLCHISGLPENIGVKRVRMREQPSLDVLIDAMVDLPLVAPPGSELRYSNAGFGILARIVEQVTGKDFHEYLRAEVLDRAGLGGVLVQPNGDDPRIAHTDDGASAGTPVESYNSAYWRGLGIPWGGYYATAGDMATFAASFAHPAHLVLSDESRQAMIVDQTGHVPGGVVSAGVHWDRGAWGLGWEVAETKQRHWTGSLRAPETYCHWGQSGTLVWADPTRDLALAVFGNRTVHRPWPLVPPRWAPLSDEIVRAADGI